MAVFLAFVAGANLALPPLAGRMVFGSDSRLFPGKLSGVSNQSRNMITGGSFFAGATSPVGGMGGAKIRGRYRRIRRQHAITPRADFPHVENPHCPLTHA